MCPSTAFALLSSQQRRCPPGEFKHDFKYLFQSRRDSHLLFHLSDAYLVGDEANIKEALILFRVQNYILMWHRGGPAENSYSSCFAGKIVRPFTSRSSKTLFFFFFKS